VNFVKLPHTVFALPFALVGVTLASWHAPVTPAIVLWVVVAFTAARFAAIARLVDEWRPDALVVGVDLPQWAQAVAARKDCPNSSLELEGLSKAVQKRLGLPRLTVPVLLGRAEGAALVYANLVQAPPETFLGGVSLGFAPRLNLGRPLCPGRGLVQRQDGRVLAFPPVTTFPLRWQVI